MNMKIAVSSISFSKSASLREKLLNHFTNVEFNFDGKKLEGMELIQFLQGAEGLIVGTEPIDGSLLKACPELKYISKYGVGLDNIDLEACARHQVGVGYTLGVNREAVAEQALGLIISLMRNLHLNHELLKKGKWNKVGGQSLSGKILGIIGLGYVGKALAKLAQGMGMHVWANDILDLKDYASQNGITLVSLPELLKNSHIVSLHVPLTDDTYHLMDRKTLEQMRPESYLVNTCRGKVVNQEDLKWALQNHVISGAALDVFEEEPCRDRKLLELPHLICTPHTCGNSLEAVELMGTSAIHHILNYFKTR